MLNTTHPAAAHGATESVVAGTLRELFQATPLYLFASGIKTVLAAKR